MPGRAAVGGVDVGVVALVIQIGTAAVATLALGAGHRIVHRAPLAQVAAHPRLHLLPATGVTDLGARPRRILATAQRHCEGEGIACVRAAIAQPVAEHRNTVVRAPHGAAEAELEIGLALRGIPESHVTTIEEQLACRPQALGEIGLVALSGAAGVAPIVGSSAGHVVQGKKSARTVAVRRQTHVGSGTGHVALVVQPQAVAGNAGASGQLCLRVGDVDADGTHWRVDSGTGNRSAIALRDLNTPNAVR